MEVNRKLNAFGAILGAVGIFGIIISLMILMNSIQYLRGITDEGQVTFTDATVYNIDGDSSILYQSEDGKMVVEIPMTEEEFEAFSGEDIEPISRRVYMDANGVYYYYEDLDAKPMAVLEEINMPFKLPILILIVAAILAVGGFFWCFHGKPTKGKDLGEIIQAKKEEEEAANKTESDEGADEKADSVKEEITEKAESDEDADENADSVKEETGEKTDSGEEVIEKAESEEEKAE